MPKVGGMKPCKSVCIGIDPGQNGGVAWLDGATGIIQAVPMPATETDLWYLVDDLALCRAKAVLELVHSMPKQGVSSTFKFGVGYGTLRMALIAAAIPFVTVSPQRWQKELGIPPRKKTETPSQWKNRLKARAQELFPNVPITLKTADAILLACYCCTRT